MPGKDYAKTEDQASQEQVSRVPAGGQESDMQRLLSTLDQVFSTFQNQLQSKTPEPLKPEAVTAVEAFREISDALDVKAVGKRSTTAPSVSN
jgi:hypothetical protein